MNQLADSPALRAISTVRVEVGDVAPALRNLGVTGETIAVEVGRALEGTALRVSDAGDARLVLRLNGVPIAAQSGVQVGVAFTVETYIEQDATLAAKDLAVRAITWKRSAIGVAPKRSVAREISAQVREHVQMLIQAHEQAREPKP